MAVPKGKVSRQRRDKRRSSHWKLLQRPSGQGHRVQGRSRIIDSERKSLRKAEWNSTQLFLMPQEKVSLA